MSWSKSYPNRAAFTADVPSHATPSTDEDELQQMACAREAAAALIVSRGVVNGDQDCSVYMSGHSNPLHFPRAGWSNDCVTITVSQLNPAAPTPTEPSEESTDG